jgi:hypothetical protein
MNRWATQQVWPIRRAALCVLVMVWVHGLGLIGCEALSQEVPLSIREKLAESCWECHHGSEADGNLNLDELNWQLSDPATFHSWTKMVDRVARGEMPPDSGWDLSVQQAWVEVVQSPLVDFNRQQQSTLGRTPLRRLNRFEYERTVQQLLGIHRPLAHLLPEETPLHGFDTVSDGLRFSPLHIDKYLDAADVALGEAIQLGEPPKFIDQRFLYKEQEGILRNLKEEKSILRDLGDEIAIFADASYITRLHGIYLSQSGRYRIRARGRAFQSKGPVILKLHAGNWQSGSTRVLGFFDLEPHESSEVEVIAWLDHGEYLYPAPDDLDTDSQGQRVWNSGGAKYEGEGIAIEWLEVEGPLGEVWPPESLSRVFGDTPVSPLEKPQWKDGKRIAYELQPQDPKQQLSKVVEDFATRAFRRPLQPGESQVYAKLGEVALDEGVSFEEAVRLALRAVLTSPQFLILQEAPGKLSDYALATRLSYFLWGTLPDQALLDLAAAGKLGDSNELRGQTERLLDDPRSEAFVESFVDQWLDLRKIDATTPDRRLYPEFDELLKISMLSETHAFFRELIEKNLPADSLIDSDFVMINRRLADHYRLSGVRGQQMQRVPLPSNSERGGVLTQASVLKVTANGTVTSPVTRGSWVMSKLLLTPPSAPPPGIGSIEPDTRGATTVRDQLDRHRSDPGCASCHRSIDPPGFALESFDVIGGWRERYRSTDQGDPPQEKLHGRRIHEYKLGPEVDASGVLPDGRAFENVQQFKTLLLEDREQIARGLASQLLIYATGQRIQLADREEIQQIILRTKEQGWQVRDLIHAVVQSNVFRSK